jgi:stage III sporulation protein AG
MKNNGDKKQIKLKDILKNKYALLILAVGLILVLLPTGTKTKTSEPTSGLSAPAFSIADEEGRLEKQLSLIKGAGKVSVLLSVKGSAYRELAESKDETLVVSENGDEKVVDLNYVNPEYLGAVIVCEGAGSADVRLEVTNAVAVYTGLATNKITVISMN